MRYKNKAAEKRPCGGTRLSPCPYILKPFPPEIQSGAVFKNALQRYN